MNKKTLSILLALGIIISAGYFGVNYIKASDETRPMDTLITRIAEKFNLKKEDVEAVFDSVHQEKMEEMAKEREEKLNQAVSDGIITQTQKDALFSKMNENQNERRENREEMQQWFKDQNIDQEKLMPYMGFGRKGHCPRNGEGFGK